MAERVVCSAEACDESAREEAALAVEQQILDFVYGRTDGAVVLDALYGDTLDELLPSRLTDMLQNWRVA